MKNRSIKLTRAELRAHQAAGNRRIAIGLAVFALFVFVVFIFRHGWTST